MKTVEAIVDEKGDVKSLEAVQLPAGQRLLVTVVDDLENRDVKRLRGFLNYRGIPRTLAEMEQAIIEGAGASDRH